MSYEEQELENPDNAFELICPTMAELEKKVRELETRVIDLYHQTGRTEKRLLERINRGYKKEGDPDYDRKHLEKVVRDIIEDVFEEKGRMGDL